MTAFPVIRLAGTERERGLAYGRQLADRIHRTFTFYTEVVFKNSPLSATEFQTRSEALMALTRARFPGLVCEIEAIAEGAGIAAWRLFLLNARTEILNASVGECTSLAAPASRILAQTWDWIRELEDLVVVTVTERADGHRIVALTEPGMLAKIGMNSAGVGVGLNFLRAAHTLDGVPVHILLRAMLDCTDLGGVREAVARSGSGKSSFVPVATDRGEAVGFEFAGNAMDELGCRDGVLLHTNHCLSDRLTGDALPSSQARLDTTRANLAATEGRDFAAIARMLSDRGGGELAVLSDYHPVAEMNGLSVGTCATVIMELDKRVFSIRRAPNPDGAFQRIEV